MPVPITDNAVFNPSSEIDASTMTIEEAQDAVRERNHRRERYGSAVITVALVEGGEPGTGTKLRGNEPVPAYLPPKAWGRLLMMMERAAIEAEHYAVCKDWSMYCEAIRQDLQTRGF